jgi:hypothetical protein
MAVVTAGSSLRRMASFEESTSNIGHFEDIAKGIRSAAYCNGIILNNFPITLKQCLWMRENQIVIERYVHFGHDLVDVNLSVPEKMAE